MNKKTFKSPVAIENAEITFRNFRGLEKQYNPAGRRNFGVRLPMELARKLKKDGWNVRGMEGKEGYDPEPYLAVTVRYDNIPPRIILITSKNKLLLSEEDVGELDHAEILNVDLIITPHDWELKNGNKGTKGYLKTMYVTIVEDQFADKYEDVPRG